MKVLGVDFGYGYVKYFDGKNKKKIVSLVAPSRYLRFSTGMAEKDPLNFLDVEIAGGRYFVGSLAKEQGLDPFQVLDKDKVFHETTKILLYSVLARLSSGEVFSVSGLPVSYYDEEKVEYLKGILRGKHAVKFFLNGKPEERTFSVKDVLVIPQAVGSFFDLLLDSNGNVRKENSKLSESTVAVIDIGFGTTDFAVIRNLEYIDKSSRSIAIGVKDLLEMIREEIAKEAKEELALYEIEDYITKGKTEIPLRGRKIDISKVLAWASSTIFSKLKTVSDYLWDKEKTIDLYLITGGGSILLGKLFRDVYGKKVSVVFADDPSFSNVVGFYKYGVRKWRNVYNH